MAGSELQQATTTACEPVGDAEGLYYSITVTYGGGEVSGLRSLGQRPIGQTVYLDVEAGIVVEIDGNIIARKLPTPEA